MNLDYSVGEVEISYMPTKINITKVTNAETSYKAIRPAYSDKTIQHRESFKVMFLNCQSELIGYTTISEGGLTETPVDIRYIFQVALLTNAVGMILTHNHPSGNLRPSKQDIELTKKVIEAGKILQIRVLDHLIITKDDYYSFTENGLIL